MRILVLELKDQDSPIFDKIMEVVKCCTDIEHIRIKDEPMLSLPGLEIYPGRRKIYRKVWGVEKVRLLLFFCLFLSCCSLYALYGFPLHWILGIPNVMLCRNLRFATAFLLPAYACSTVLCFIIYQYTVLFFKISVSAPAQGRIPKDEKAAAGL